MKRIFSLVFALLLLPVMALGTLAADVPEPSSDFYVYDGAGTLSESTKDLILNASGPLEQYCDGAQIVVVTIDYLPSGYDSEQYANLLFNSWGVGSSSANNGLLLLHVVKEDRGWLAVGAGISKQMTSSYANSLMDEYFWPYSDAGEYDEAVATLFPHLVDFFAQLYGTVALLAPEDRVLLRGLVVNKFRGDVEILRPGLAPLEKMCGVPVVGVVPYLTLDLDDEDSLAPRLSAREARGVIDVAVVRLPHLSNFTDFDPLSRVPGVGVRYVSSTTDLGRPDLVVLPGSKTTLDDARWLAASGIGACVRALSGAGTPVLGICGGYQLLGDELSDPHGREGAGTARGLGLIPASTVFKEEKRLAQSELRITGAQGAFSVWNGMTARGYEIHDGATTVSCAPAGTIGGKPEGAACGNVFGTYLHGLFDEPGVALALARSLARMRGLPESVVGAAGATSAADHRAREFDRLADGVRGALDMEYVYRIIEEGV